jgi:hypothetical protein
MDDTHAHTLDGNARHGTAPKRTEVCALCGTCRVAHNKPPRHGTLCSATDEVTRTCLVSVCRAVNVMKPPSSTAVATRDPVHGFGSAAGGAERSRSPFCLSSISAPGGSSAHLCEYSSTPALLVLRYGPPRCVKEGLCLWRTSLGEWDGSTV